ncbi:MAG: hypothetical protein H6R26_3494 [Proteobacteria bacterium]|nr:hypothetical protein [Pseudomonadota bacterium]
MYKMYKRFLMLAALSAFTAVGFGAFGAHGLKARLDEHMMAVYQTGVQYHFWHALGLGLIATLVRFHPASALLRWAGMLMFAGILVFSGSLYVLAISGIGWLGAITPFGGTAFLAAWLLVAMFAAKLDE